MVNFEPSSFYFGFTKYVQESMPMCILVRGDIVLVREIKKEINRMLEI